MSGIRHMMRREVSAGRFRVLIRLMEAEVGLSRQEAS
jgi:hypothetical protein